MYRRIKSLSMIGVICVAVTAGIFFLVTSDRNAVLWMGFESIVLAELILFAGLILIERSAEKVSQIIFRTVAGGAVIVAPVVVIILSLISMVTGKPIIIILFVVQLILYAIAIILCIIAYHAALGVKENSDNIVAAESQLKELISKLRMLSAEEKNKAYAVRLNKIADEITYSDLSATVAADRALEEELAKLELLLLQEKEELNVEIDSVLRDMLLLVNRRKAEVRTLKNGGI